MRIRYWNPEVQRGWKGELRTEMLEHNIFCYGKRKSGKTEKVALPFFRHALESGRSVLLILPKNDTSYDTVIDELDDDTDYDCRYHHASYYEAGEAKQIVSEAEQLAEYLVNHKCIFKLYVDLGKRCQCNTAMFTLRCLQDTIKWDEEDYYPVSVIVENSDWSCLFYPQGLESSYMNFCITANGDQLSPWVAEERYAQYLFQARVWDDEFTGAWEAHRDNIGQIIEKKDHAAVIERLSGLAVSEYALRYDLLNETDKFYYAAARDSEIKSYLVDMNTCKAYAGDVLSFWCHVVFCQIQTVICTGGVSISPEMHKSFIREMFVGPEVKAPAGKFLVTDLTTTPQPSMSVFPKTVLQAGKQDVENIFREGAYGHGGCIVERNGSVMLHAAADGSLRPMVYPNFKEARKFLQAYMVGAGLGMLAPVEMDGCSMRFLLPTTNDEGRQDEIMVSYIQECDIEAYVDQTMMLAMEIEEYLHDKERQKEVPALDMAKDAPNVSLQKIIYHVNRTHRKIRKLGMAEIPLDENTNEPVASMADEYAWVPYCTVTSVADEMQTEAEEKCVLPSKRVLFLGGHINMVKKLRQIFPGWQFLTDDELSNWTGNECDVIFFWTKHCSHLVMQYVNARKDKNTPYIYVTATNINRLISEMNVRYKQYLAAHAS